MGIDPRFIKGQGREVFTGNELLVKGALETEGGVHLLTGYPGSPIAGFFDTLESLAELLEEHGVVARLANNEALSMAMVNGAQMAGCRAITAFKSVGLHVASDALALGVLAGTRSTTPPGSSPASSTASSTASGPGGGTASAPGSAPGNAPGSTTNTGHATGEAAKPEPADPTPAANVSGGLVIIGDDPWSDSTQVPADSRYLCEHVRLPAIEPCNPQEIKDWVDLGFKLGHAGRIFVGLIVTTSVADGGGSVECRPNHYPSTSSQRRRTLSYERDIAPHLDNTVLLPPRTWQRELTLETRLSAVKAEAHRLGVNRILQRPQKDEVVPLGFIAAGSAYAYLAHALTELGLAGRLPILKLGLVYPVDEAIVLEFARQCRQVVVIEERRNFVERQVLDILNPLRQKGEMDAEVFGKRFPRGLPGCPSTRGLNPSLLIELLVPLLRDHPTLPIELTNGHLTAELARIQETATYQVNLPGRTPTFCPGCPHRDSSAVLLDLRRDLLDPQYMLQRHKRKPVDLVAHGDTGCYTMLMFEPNKPLMHNYSGMGLGGGTGSGVDPFIDNKQIVFMGDSTFFHSGQVAISHSIKAGQDITYIILDNKTTAMTGHQSHPGVELDLMGKTTFAQDIERIVTGMVPKQIARDVRVVRIDPSDRDRYRRLLEDTILAPGVKVVIADKECGITFHRRARSQERAAAREIGFVAKKTYMNVATEVCEFCLECTSQTGCPGLTFVDTDYGPKVQTDFSWCVNDGACARVDACPSFEEVTVLRKSPPRMGDEHVRLDDLPPPPRPIHAQQDTWRCYLAGVGGMGIGLCTAILTAAGHEMGYHVEFLDKKGLAIRNGGVFSQLVYTRNADHRTASGDPSTAPPASAQSAIGNRQSAIPFTTPHIPYGKADLLLGVDILEATRAIDPRHPYRVASPGRTSAVVNTAFTPTILTLLGKDDFDPSELETTLRRYTRPEHFVGFNVGDLCERVLDSKLYANIMMLGIAFQKGYLPLTLEVLERSIRSLVRQEFDRNWRAFHIGRKIAVRPDLFTVELRHDVETARQAVRRKLTAIRAGAGTFARLGRRRRDRLAKRFRVLCKQTFHATRGKSVDDALMRDVVIRAYDCLVWGGFDYAKRYCDRLVAAHRRDDPATDFALTRAVVWNLARVMLIKDEPYVAAMLTSPEKYKRDRRRFNVNPERGDRIVYRHYNRPEFHLLGVKLRFKWRSRDWQLRLMARMGWARSLFRGWHRREREFRDWYTALVDRYLASPAPADPRQYARWLAVLSTPESVTGFREVRYPKMEAARRRADQLLATDLELFEPLTLDHLRSRFGDEESSSFSRRRRAATHAATTLSLPVLSVR